MSMTIRGIGLAVPPNTMTQEQAAELASTVICRTEQQQRVLTALYRKAGIENRHSVLPYKTALNWLPDSPTGKQQDRPATLGPTTAVRMQYFAEHAPPLAKNAAAAALAEAGGEVAGGENGSSAGQTWRLKATGSCLIPDSQPAMSWRIGDHGFEMTLDACVPEMIEQHLRPWLIEWLGGHGLSLDAVGSWA